MRVPKRETERLMEALSGIDSAISIALGDVGTSTLANKALLEARGHLELAFMARRGIMAAAEQI